MPVLPQCVKQKPPDWSWCGIVILSQHPNGLWFINIVITMATWTLKATKIHLKSVNHEMAISLDNLFGEHQNHHHYGKGCHWQCHALGKLFTSRDWKACNRKGEHHCRNTTRFWVIIQCKTVCKKAMTKENISFPARHWPQEYSKATQKRFTDKIKVMKLPSQSSDFHPAENFWLHLKRAVHTLSLSSLAESKLFCKEEWREKNAVSRCTSLTETYPHRLSVVTAIKSESTKYWPEGAEYLCKHNFKLICCTSAPCYICKLSSTAKDCLIGYLYSCWA